MRCVLISALAALLSVSVTSVSYTPLTVDRPYNRTAWTLDGKRIVYIGKGDKAQDNVWVLTIRLKQ